MTIIHVAEACPDPYGHTRLYGQREMTWREGGNQRPLHGICGWCGELIDTPGSVADDDLRAELAAEAREYAWLERWET